MARYLDRIIFILFLPSLLYSQYEQVKFEHLSVEEGLSYSVVNCILQDRQGMMWFGTMDGLNRYDGYTFTVYKNIPGDSSSLSHNWVNVLYEDHSGQLWIGTASGGLCRYNREKDNFVCYVHNEDDPNSLASNGVYTIFESIYKGKTTLWVGTLHGVNRYNPESDNFIRYLPEENNPNNEKYKTNNNSVNSGTQDSSNRVWISTLREGLFYFNPETDCFVKYQAKPAYRNIFKNERVTRIHLSREDGREILWTGTVKNGLYKIDLESDHIKNYLLPADKMGADSDSRISATYSSGDVHKQLLWIGTYNGLYRFDTKREEFFLYRNEPGNLTSLSSNIVEVLFEDRSGVLWIGTDRGLNKLNPQLSNFTTFGAKIWSPNSLNNYTVKALCETDFGGHRVLWIGTFNGLNRYDRTTGRFSYLTHDPANLQSLTSNKITAIIKTQVAEHQYLWVGAIGGFNKIDLNSGVVSRIHLPEPDIYHYNIWALCTDDSGRIWIGLSNSTLYCYSPQTETFTRYSGYRSINALCFDSQGDLWIGTLAGLKRLTVHSGKFVWYRYNQDDTSSISNNDVLSILEDRNKVMWFGTTDGLNRFDRNTGTFARFSEKDGLPSSAIHAILEDNRGHLWLSTGKGISEFDPGGHSLKNFDASDGLQGDQFKVGAAYKNSEGELFFGGVNGFTMFHPDKIRENSFMPPVVLTDFQIFNKSIKPGKNSLLKKQISEMKEIVLPHHQSVFSFEFAALDFHNPRKNQYAYQLEGIDPDWVYTDALRRFVTYTNLNPGNYVFRVKGSNNDGIWNEEGTSLNITILPPWWRTRLAYSLYVILLLGVVLGAWQFQANRLKMKQQLEMRHFEAEKLREVDRLKSHFFANISHEFRTPLTLIQGPVKQMLSGEIKGNLKEQYRMILRNSGRLLNLINQILDLSKLEAGRMQLKVEQTDIVQFLKGIIQSFVSLAERQNISLKINTGAELIVGYVDRDKMEKIVTNLLSNAFKFTPVGGKIIVDFGVRNSELKDNSKIIEIQISNTGPGIPPDQLDKIFDRFHQLDDSYRKDSEGSGIGLALTKELVQAGHGEIKVESEPDKITTFIVMLPVDKEHFEADEIFEGSETGDLNRETGKDFSRKEVIEELPISSIQYQASSIETPRVTSDSESQSPASGLLPPLLLIVEDNPDVATYISGFMEKEYQISTAENGKLGWKKALEKSPDLVISDVMMPEMDGFELCKKLKSDERTSHIPVILLTARADIESKLEGLEFGADDYVSKPFDARELQIRSKNLIEQRKKLRDKFAGIIEVHPEDITVTSIDEQFLQRILTIFEKNLSDSDYNTEKFAREVGISRSQLNRKLNALTNLPTHGFMLNLRLKRAAKLLKGAAGTVSEIAYQVGFNNTSHFAKAFRKQYGLTPSEFSKKEFSKGSV